MTALILTYHAVEDGPSPLCVTPDRFRSQLDQLADLGLTTLTVSELAASLRDQTVIDRAVAITFDDGCASAVRTAVPALLEREMTATLFCVAGHLGGWNDWLTQPTGVPRLELATGDELNEIARLGFEIGAHGMSHASLGNATDENAHNELVMGKAGLEAATGCLVQSLAYPYGVEPSRAAARLAATVFSAACTTELARVTADSDPLALPRVDAHYLRRQAIFSRVVAGGLDPYLRARALARGLHW